MDENDPVVASYDVFLTDSQIARYVFQFPDRDREPEIGGPYNERAGQKPAVLRLKPKTGLVEIDVPINTSSGFYDTTKGVKYGEALKDSRVLKGGGAFGLAGGFNPNAPSRVKMEGGSVDTVEDTKSSKIQTILRTQTLSGRIKDAHEGDPLYMLGAFRGKNLFISPVSAVVQMRPQLHHIDAFDETSKTRMLRGKKDAEDDGAREAEARPVDVKIKTSEGGESAVPPNVRLLREIQDERWENYEWVDAETEDSWATYETYMIHNNPEDLPELEAAIDEESYLDAMSAPRIDPAHPEMTGWAMKQNRKKNGDNQ